jgi:hypothetical protein
LKLAEEAKEQAVVEEKPDEQAKPVSEGADAQDDEFEAALAEFDSAIEDQAQATPEPGGGPSNDEVLRELQEVKQRLTQREYQDAMGNLVESVRGDLGVPDNWVRGWINAEAESNPKLQRAWDNQRTDPAGFKRVVAALGKKFAKEYEGVTAIDANATADREAVTQAVRGSSNKAPEGGNAPDYSGMGDAEAREAIRKDFGFDPGF